MTRFFSSKLTFLFAGLLIISCSCVKKSGESGVSQTDTDPNVIDTRTGQIKLQDQTIVLFGGPIVNAAVNYYEKNRIAPLYWRSVSNTFYWHTSDGTRLDETSMRFSEIDAGSQDMFIVESFIDNSGNRVFIVYGYGWRGTFAAGLFFPSVVYPNIDSYLNSWYVYRWQDANGDKFVDLDEIDPAPVVEG